MDAVFQDYEIDVNKITNIVTDASSFCKMFKIFGNEPDASTALENTYSDDDEDGDDGDVYTGSGDDFNYDIIVEDNDSDPSQLFMAEENGELLASEIISFEPTLIDTIQEEGDLDSYFDQPSVQGENTIKLPPQRRCESHELNLVSSDFEKQLPDFAKSALTSAYGKLYSVCVFTHRSTS